MGIGPVDLAGDEHEHALDHGTAVAVRRNLLLSGVVGVLAGLIGLAFLARDSWALDAPLGRIPIIGISGRGEDEAASRAAGADIFLVKPVSPRALATALHEATGPSAIATS